MISTRQEPVNNNNTDNPTFLSSTSAICQKLQCDSNIEPGLLKSYVDVAPVIFQPATIKKSSLIFLSPEDNKLQKDSEGIKSSSHEVKVVSCPDGACDFLVSPLPFPEIDKKDLPGSGKYVYLFTPDHHLFYLDKYEKKPTPISLNEEQQTQLRLALNIKPSEDKAALLENLDQDQIRMIAKITKHIHCKAYYKEYNKPGSIMSVIEATHSLMYQLKADGLYSTCFAVRDENDQDTGVVSMHLNGFKPMGDKPLNNENLTITSLDLITKKRDDTEKEKILKIFRRIQKKIIPLLDRTPDSNLSYFWQFYQAAKNKVQYWAGSEFNALNIESTLNSYITSGKQGIDLLSLGSLSSLRKLLINRRNQILDKPDSFNHKHELKILKKCTDELSLIILNETAFYMKAMREIDKKARDNWVDIEAEVMRDKSAIYDVIRKGDYLIADVSVSYEDLLHFRMHCGQAIALASRYFAMDPDGHKRNNSASGDFIDGDLAFCLLVFDLLDKVPYTWRKEDNNFNFYPEDFMEFPDLTQAVYRYWVNSINFFYRAFDKVTKTAGSDASQNFYNDTDVDIFKNFAHCPVFCFQKYIQLAIECLMSEKLYTVCAELHMSNQLRMRDAKGNKLSLINPKENYELQYMSCLHRLPGNIYLEFVAEGLQYELIGHDATLKSHVIPWQALPHPFPTTHVCDIIEQPEQKEKYLQVLLRETSREGHTNADWANDVRTRWIKCGTQRSQDAKTELAMKLMPFKFLLEHHGDFIWECVEEHFKSFLDRKQAKCMNRCDLSLMSIDDVNKIEKWIFEDAKIKKIPVLIKTKNSFKIYGDPKNDGNWQLTDIETTPELGELCFDAKPDIIKHDDTRFTPTLIETLKRSHAPLIPIVEILESVINLDELKIQFDELREEILAANPENKPDNKPENEDCPGKEIPSPGVLFTRGEGQG